jgi:hypothetical protein
LPFTIEREGTMRKKTFTPLLGQVLQKIAPQIGATVIIEPKWKIVGQIIYRRRFNRGSGNQFCARAGPLCPNWASPRKNC